jgi:hypothetical protein
VDEIVRVCIAVEQPAAKCKRCCGVLAFQLVAAGHEPGVDLDDEALSLASEELGIKARWRR